MSILTLAIESAIRGGSIAIFNDGKIAASWSGNSGVSKAEDLLPAVAELLKKNSIRLYDIDQIAVSVGPGSFTGLRIGISTVMGLSDSTGIEAFGMSALAAIASNASAISAVVPIGKHDIAWQAFDKDHAVENQIAVGSIDDLLAAKPADPVFYRSIMEEHFESITRVFGELNDSRICSNAAVEIGRCSVVRPEMRLPLEPLYVQNPRYISLF